VVLLVPVLLLVAMCPSRRLSMCRLLLVLVPAPLLLLVLVPPPLLLSMGPVPLLLVLVPAPLLLLVLVPPPPLLLLAPARFPAGRPPLLLLALAQLVPASAAAGGLSKSPMDGPRSWRRASRCLSEWLHGGERRGCLGTRYSGPRSGTSGSTRRRRS